MHSSWSIARAATFAATAAALGVGSTARADEPAEVIEIEGEYSDELLAPGFRTVVDVDTHDGETTSLAEVLAQTVGVNVRSLGGLGGFASVSIRGASPSHTALFVDGVPMATVGTTAADLGAHDLVSFSRVEIYRGAVPVELGGAAMGGAVQLRTHLGPDDQGNTARLSAGMGSFGARHLNARIHDRSMNGRLLYHLGLGYRGATGDYEYFNDNGTPLRLDDDTFTIRKNNGFDQISGVARARLEWAHTRLELGSRTTWKDQGIPGVGSVQAESASLDGISQLVDLQLDHAPQHSRTALSAKVFVTLESQQYRDVDGQVGLGTQHNHYRTLSLGAWTRARHRTADRRHVFATGAEARVERHRITDLLGDEAMGPRGARLSGALSLSDDVRVVERFHLVPALRVDAHHTDPGDGWSPIVATEATVRSNLYLTPRVTARWLHRRAVLKANVGRYYRAPTLIELYGDRGFLVGNPELVPETGLSADAGVVLMPEGVAPFIDRLYLQAAAFVSRPEDAIVLMPSSGNAAVAENLGDATLLGGEAALAIRLWRALSLLANYTYVESRQDSPLISYDGKRLPLRPRHQAYFRGEGVVRAGGHAFGLWADLAYTSGNFLDAANLSEVPRRVLLGGGVKLRAAGHVLVGIEVKNLTNNRLETIGLDPPPNPMLANVPRAVSDFLGYPLPGRAFYLTVDTTL